MYDPFVVQQAYILNYTLALLPQMIVDPDALSAQWQPVSAFVDQRVRQKPVLSGIGQLRRPSASHSALWRRDKWRFSDWPRPWIIDAPDWRLDWLPNANLPAGSNPSTRLFIHLYPLGAISIGLATAVGFGDGIDIEPLILLLKQMTPAKAGGPPKLPWLRLTTPDDPAGQEVTLDNLAALVLDKVRASLFQSPDTAQIVRHSDQPDEPCLEGHNGGIIELVRTVPERFDRSKHAAGFRGIVCMRPSWQETETERLIEYRDAKAWTGRKNAWHYVGGLNTVLWSGPKLSRHHIRRGYPWRVEAIAELARIEKMFYEYSRDYVAPQLHAPLDRWKPLWRILDRLPKVLRTYDMDLTYESHARAIKRREAREELDAALAQHGDVDLMERKHLVRLRQTIVERFNESDLRTLCFDLGIDYDDLGGRGKADNVRELLDYLYRRRRIRELLAKCKQERPDVDWEDLDERD